MGLDDSELARHSSPPLTKMRIDSHDMARAAARRLLEHAETNGLPPVPFRVTHRSGCQEVVQGSEWPVEVMKASRKLFVLVLAVSSMPPADKAPLKYLAFTYNDKPAGYSSGNEFLLMYHNKKLTKDKNGKTVDQAGSDAKNIVQHGTDFVRTWWMWLIAAVSNGSGLMSPDGQRLLIRNHGWARKKKESSVNSGSFPRASPSEVGWRRAVARSRKWICRSRT
jgi:hypothetical protein